MSTLRMLTTPFLAGPRDGLESRSEWTIALTISGGYQSAPPSADLVESWTRALMPWSMSGADAPKFYGMVLHDDGSRDVVGPFAAFTTPDANGIATADFVSAMQEAFVQRHLPEEEVKLRYDLAWDPLQFQLEAAINGGGASTDIPTLPFAPILQSLATLPPALAQAARALKYVKLPRSVLGKNDVDGNWKWAIGVSFFPAEIADTREPSSVGTINTGEIDGLGGDLYQAAYGSAPVRGYGGMLPIKTLAGAAEGTYRGDYWLPVADATGDALHDVDAVVSRLCHPAHHFERTSLDMLRSLLRVVDGGAARAVTAEETAHFAAAARAWLEEEAARLADMTSNSAASVFSALARTPPSGNVADVVRDALVEAGVDSWSELAKGASEWVRRQTGMDAPVFRIEGARGNVVERVVAEFKRRDARPGLPGEGVPFCVGDPTHRLVHEMNTSLADSDVGMGEVAGVAVVVRRVDATHSAGPWRLLTAGVPALGLGGRLFDNAAAASGTVPWLREVLPAPLAVAFVNGVLRNDYEYRGAPMRSVAPLDSTHGFSADNADQADLGASVDLSFHSPAGLAGVDPANARRTSAPLLRYGDAYDIAAFVVDRAGGYPRALSRSDGIGFDLAALDGVTPPKQARIPFRRTIPVGAVNISPMDPRISDAKKKRDWPTIPEGVVLRGLELLQARRVRDRPKDGDLANGDVPALLVSKEASAFAPETVRFWLDGPRSDEHTLLRWAAPRLGASPEEVAASKERVRDALVRVLETRNARNPTDGVDGAPSDVFDAAGLPHDPAVAGILVEGRWQDSSDAPRVLRGTPFVMPTREKSGVAFEFEPFEVIAKAGDGDASVAFDVAANTLTVSLPPGSTLLLSVAPVVQKAEFDERFDSAALGGLVRRDVFESKDGPASGSRYCVFEPNELVIEHPVRDLPSAAATYEAFGLTLVGGKVDVSVLGNLDNLCFVDRFELGRERWVWRNRPLVSEDDLPPPAEEVERRRRLASGFPPELGEPSLRDSSEAVSRFDAIAGLDRGFADRGIAADRYPRGGDGRLMSPARLLLDDHDAVTAAEYLRYRLTLRSRYAPLYPGWSGAVTAASGQAAWQTWRRILVPYRGATDRIKSPLVLSVLPLTSHVGPGGDTAAGRATPHLVVLDETWFREYGVGERLEARLSLETIDIGEAESAPRPYRAGPLPDHHLPVAGTGGPYDKSRYFRSLMKTDEEDRLQPVLLELFGPFGYSMDRSGNEALANASAFVVYPPKEAGPQWALYARFHRLLDWPSHGHRSPASEAYALYTHASSDRLAFQPANSGDLQSASTAPRLTLKADGSTRLDGGLVLALDPLDLERPGRSLAAQNYAYVVLVSSPVFDGGRGLEIELPLGMVWIDHLQDSLEWRPDVSSKDMVSGREYLGRVIELILNGKDAQEDLERIRRAAGDIRLFWRQLLPKGSEAGAGEDAPAAVRRVSRAFRISLE